MRDFLPKLLLPLVLCGCSDTADVVGKIGPEAERFYGVAKFYENGSTAIEMVSASGVKCVAAFRYAKIETRAGNLTCNDGRVARMRFTALSRVSGYGYGIADDGSRVALFYGLSEDAVDRYLPLAASTE